jgi:PAS domain S-box-containing protein
VSTKKTKSEQINDLPSDFLSSEEMFNHAFEFAPIGMTIVGPKGDFWKANRAFCEFIGYTAEELSQKKVFDITFPEDQQTSIDLRDQLMSGDILANREEKRYIRKDGSVVWGLMTRSVAYAAENEILYTMGHIQDITELKKTQATLVESEKRYARAISGTADGIWEVDLQTGEDFKSPQWKSMLGYDEDEIGDTNDDFLDLLHPDDLEIASAAMQQRLRTDEPVDYSVRMRHKKGHYIDIQSRGQVFRDENGKPLYISGAHTDITELKRREKSLRESEERYRSLIETSPDAVVVVSAKQKVLFANQQAAILYAADDPERLIGKAFRDFVHPDYQERANEQREERMRTGHHGAFVFRHITMDGRSFDAEVAAVTIPWDGEEAGLLIIRDISELQKVSRLKDEFVSTVSHELRTPLTSIKGSLGLLQAETLGELPEKIKAMIEIAYSNSDRLVLLINDILDIQKFESGKSEFKMRKLDAAELVKNAIEANKGYSDTHKVSFVLTESSPNIFINGDEARLTQVLSNLLSNAAKFSPENSTVEISVSEQDEDALISVKDNGCGIAEEDHDQIFKKFTQVDSTDTRQIGGTGLGLSISKSIVEQHGGKIDFESDTDKGSTFYFTLPLLE